MLPNSQASLSPMKENVCFCMLLSIGIPWKSVPHCWPCVPKRRHSGDTKIDRVNVAVQYSPVCKFNLELICYQLISQWFIRFCIHCHSYYWTNRSQIVKDLSMMYRALWDRRHEGATRISQCTRRVVAPECLRSHNARYIMLKSDYDMNFWFWYITKPKFAGEVAKRGVANHALYKIYA